MKVTIGSYTITDGVTTSPTNLSVNEERSDEVAKGLRWASAKAFDRGNKQTTVSFEVHREHSSLGEAEKFVVTHGKDVPNNGLLTMTTFDKQSTYIAGAQCRTIAMKHIGRSTMTNYSFIGGASTTKKPS